MKSERIGNEVWNVLWLALLSYVPASCHENRVPSSGWSRRICGSHRAEWKQLDLEPSATEAQLDQSTQRWNRAEDCLVTDNKILWVSLHDVSVTNLSDVPQAFISFYE